MFEQDTAWAGAGRIADVFKFAAGGGTLEGEVPVACLNRLTDQLAADEGVICWQLSGRPDVEGIPRLDLAVSGRLALRCQRCLGGLDWDMEIAAALLLVRVGQELPEDDLENDEVDVIEVDGSGEFDVLSLVEDEIILALPIAPRHADCGMLEAGGTNGDVRDQQPFAVLAGLRDKENL
ncbi:MAG: YceD family protein [Betaproteobacteria bacterium]|nr:YceD family protein [Betaproteobacteria bacterium]